LPVTYTASDTVCVPFIDEQATTTFVEKEVLYDSGTGTKTVLVRVRIKGYIPFESPSTVTSGGMSVAAIKNVDSIYQA